MNSYSNKAKVFGIINLMGYVLTVVVNALANSLPINGKTTGELSDAYPNLFVPAGITFAIWGLIYVALGLFILYQLGFLSKGKKKYMEVVLDIGWSFAIASAANIMWIFAWHYQKLLISVLIMLILLVSLIDIYEKVNKYKMDSLIEKLALQGTFSIYLGWISVATIANITTLLVSIGWNGFGISPQIWTMIVIVIATALTFRFLFYKKDILYALVTEWALGGILLKHLTFFGGEYKGIIITTALCMVLIFIGIMIVWRSPHKYKMKLD